MKANNLSGMKGVKTFTDTVRAEVVSLLPIVSLVDGGEGTTTDAGPAEEDPKTLATNNASDVSLMQVCVLSHMCLPPSPKTLTQRPPTALCPRIAMETGPMKTRETESLLVRKR